MTQVWGHRGACAYAPENTIPSFELAIAQGADGLEFDVQLSKDGVPVVIHDETVDRTTSGQGNVADLTVAELRSLDASAGMSQYTGVRIPTLSDVLDLVTKTQLAINIELKNSTVDYPGLEAKVLSQIDAYQIKQRVTISSFNHVSLRRIQTLTGATIQLAVLYSDILFKPWHYVAKLGIPGIHPPYQFISRKYVRKAHESGLKVRPWTVNNKQALRRMMRWGVDAVITDAPDVAIRAREHATRLRSGQDQRDSI